MATAKTPSSKLKAVKAAVNAVERPPVVKGAAGDGKPMADSGMEDLPPYGAAPDFSGEVARSTVNPLALLEPMRDKLRHLIQEAEETAQVAAQAADDLMAYQIVELPEAMQLAGVTELKFSDGAVLKVKPDVKASITEANRPDAHEWLRDHNHGAVIKTFFEVDLRALDDETREALSEHITGLGVEPITKESIHNATLKSLVKELLEKGTTLPASISVHEFKKAELKEPKLSA